MRVADERYRRGSVLLELSRTTALLSRLFERQAGAARPLHGALLTLIHILGPITPTDLERESGLPATTLRENVQALLAAGLVRRVPNPDDRRSYFLDSTPEGKAALDAAVPAMRAVEEEIEHELGIPLESYREQVTKLREAAQRLLER